MNVSQKATFCLEFLNGRKMIVCYLTDITEQEKQQSSLDMEIANTENLLLNIFPKEISIRVKNNERNVCEIAENVACLCTDMVFISFFRNFL